MGQCGTEMPVEVIITVKYQSLNPTVHACDLSIFYNNRGGREELQGQDIMVYN